MAVVPEADREEHLLAVSERNGRGRAKHHERAAIIASRVPADARARLLQQGLDSGKVSQRIFWLRREAALVEQATKNLVACVRGCAHCCNISVLVAEPEAKAIGRAIGRKVATVASDRSMIAAQAVSNHPRDRAVTEEKRDAINIDVFGVPCTFLVNSQCSIYEHRPLVCRHLFNVDDDELLCKLVSGQPIEVPYLNMQGEQAAYVAAMGDSARFADIRDWFPAV